MTTILFVCGKNRLRSPTAEHVFASHPGIDVMLAGVNKDADVPLSAEMVAEADMIFVMERAHKTKFQQQFKASLGNARLVCLDIPDRYRFMQPELVELLTHKVAPYLKL